jgi:hypothetical protein
MPLMQEIIQIPADRTKNQIENRCRFQQEMILGGIIAKPYSEAT